MMCVFAYLYISELITYYMLEIRINTKFKNNNRKYYIQYILMMQFSLAMIYWWWLHIFITSLIIFIAIKIDQFSINWQYKIDGIWSQFLNSVVFILQYQEMEPFSNKQNEEANDVEANTQNTTNLHTNLQQGGLEEQSSSSDDLIDEDNLQQQFEKPKPQIITQNECFQDDEIEDSDDDLVQQANSMIYDSEQEQQRQLQKIEEKQNKQPVDQLKLFDYQNILFNRSLNSNRIIYLPTGKGKTLVSIASMYYYLCREGEQDGKKIVFLANTIQLVKQQADAIKRNLARIINNEDLASSLRKPGTYGSLNWTADDVKSKVCCIHGQKIDEIGLTRRKKIQAQLSSKKQIMQKFKNSTVIVMIAQMFLNYLRRGYIKITDFSFMVFDECHHCHGNHPYAGIMRQFYFNPPKPTEQQRKKMLQREREWKLPVIMGLTASPVTLQKFDKSRLVSEISQLCANLNSKFTKYEIQKIKCDTEIQIIKTKQVEERDMIPDLIAHFEKFRDHRQAYNKLSKNFPEYFECIKQVISFLKSKYDIQMDLQADPQTITDVQLLVFYDIKECLLVKIRDIWLQLGQFAFRLAFEQLFNQLGKLNLRNQQNKLIRNKIIEIMKTYVQKFRKMYPQCKLQFCSGKVRQLIKLLDKKPDEKQDKVEMVVVFASKRRTVKYLDILMKNYRQTLPNQENKNWFSCDKVTGYSVGSTSNYIKNETIFDPDPSSMKFVADSQRYFEQFIKDFEQQKNMRQLKDANKGESRNLSSEMKRMGAIKHGKLLLEVQEKYGTQIETIKRFRLGKFRVLITTSVTQQGFDIPQCKIVISFDKPSSLKSYIQIKGRARQQFSKYYIFTNERTYNEMTKSRDFYDDIINSTFEIAINQFSDEGKTKLDENKISEIQKQQGYDFVRVKQSGALLNTSYALQIVKMYCASLRQPNKLVPYFIQTPNVAFRCILYFPKTAPTNKPYIIGKSHSNKNLALKSAAFQAVKYLYKEKYIKSDLRPKRYEQLEDQRQIQRFEDLQQTRKNPQYSKIFEKDVRVKCENVTDRKFMRFYFKTITSADLDFPKINPLFQKHVNKFEKQKFPFQIYMMNFSNSSNMYQLRKNEQNQEIGVITCFEHRYNQQVFTGYEYSFQQSNEKFTLKLVEQNLQLNKSEYEKLKNIHQFIISGTRNREVYHYSKLTKTSPIPIKWIGESKRDEVIQQDNSRQFYPILVILKKKNGKYIIDDQCNKNIQAHQKIFQKLYVYHNRAGKQAYDKKFSQNLSQNMEQLYSQLKSNSFNNNFLVQSIEKQYCFSKCIIFGKEAYDQSMQKDKDKKDKKKGLSKRNAKMLNMFDHAQENIKEVVKIVFWNKFKKQRKKQIFQRQGKLTIKEVQNSKYYLPWQFIIYPLSVSILFKASLAQQFLFKAVFEYSLAFSFRNIKLPQICKSKIKNGQNICNQPYRYYSYPNVILQNGPQIFKYLANNSGSLYLKNIGKSYKQGTNFSKPFFQFSTSKVGMSFIDQSTIQDHKNQTHNQSLNVSGIGLSQILDYSLNNAHNSLQAGNTEKTLVQQAQQKSITLISEVKVTEMLKVLTSRMYKFNKIDNYQEYEFIGDVVLKMLSTVQIFLLKEKADESQLHISRANIICNANLHRKAILKNIYKYILTKKCDELPPPFRYVSQKFLDEPRYYEKTKIQMYDQNNQIEGFHYIPGKVHADIIQALIGAFYLHSRDLNDCQLLLYFFDILKKPLLKISFDNQIMDSERNLPKIYADFEDRIQYHFKNKGLLIQALTHSSFKQILNGVIDEHSISKLNNNIHQNNISQSSFMSVGTKKFNDDISSKTVPWETFYERFEFLGDSILDLIVVEYLHDKYGTKDEGTLTSLKQAGVSNRTLGMIAIRYGMHELILMDYPENDQVMKQFKKILDNFNAFMNNPQLLIQAKVSSIKILGDVFQALIGAIFVDLQLDYNQTKEVVMRIMKEFLAHYTDLQTIKKSSSFKFKQFLDKNNYRECQIKKNTQQDIIEGKFKFQLRDRTGAVIDECWETTQKRAWDLIIERFHERHKQINMSK